MKKKEFQFYRMMWYIAPYQKELFSYFWEPRELIWWHPVWLSRAKPGEFLEIAQWELDKWGHIRKYIPFVEMVCLTGKLSFNATEVHQKISYGVVTSKKRMWLAYVISKLVFKYINRAQRKSELPEFCLRFCVAEDQLSLQSGKKWEYDIIFIYQLAHLSLRYKKFEQLPRNIYEENERLNEYLPHFPKKFVISLGNYYYFGKQKMGLFFERMLSGKIWMIFEKILMNMLLRYMVLKKWSDDAWTIRKDIIWHDEREREKYLLQWKLLRS